MITIWKFCTHMKCEVKTQRGYGNGTFMAYNGWGIYGLRMWLWLKWVGQLWQSKLLFRFEICSKIAGLQGSTLSDHRMTTGFGPFELPTYREGRTTPHHSRNATVTNRKCFNCTKSGCGRKDGVTKMLPNLSAILAPFVNGTYAFSATLWP